MHIKCPKCKNTNFCISQDTIDGVEYNVISCVIDDYIIGVYPNSDSKFKELQEKIEDLESTISDLEDPSVSYQVPELNSLITCLRSSSL